MQNRITVRIVRFLAFISLAAGCSTSGTMYVPSPPPAVTAGDSFDFDEDVETLNAAGAPANDSEVESPELRTSGGAPIVVTDEALREYVLKFSTLNVATVDSLIAADVRYLALIGAVDWSVELNSEEALHSERQRLGIPAPQDGEPSNYTEDGLARVAADFGVAAAQTEEFYVLHWHFLRDAGLTGM